ncbi:ribonuclease P protein component [Eggerthellaceae bacterium 3-80]|nr:ribonuclease P protein component [bacterium D16-34]
METIKSKEEIANLFSSGKRLRTPYLTLIMLPKKEHDLNGRVAFIAGKKNGNAVWRNKAKRRMRAICQDLKGPWSAYNIVFLAKSNICEVSYSKVLTASEKALFNAGIIKDRLYEGEVSKTTN